MKLGVYGSETKQKRKREKSKKQMLNTGSLTEVLDLTTSVVGEGGGVNGV
jgi:hypothetical protein